MEQFLSVLSSSKRKLLCAAVAAVLSVPAVAFGQAGPCTHTGENVTCPNNPATGVPLPPGSFSIVFVPGGTIWRIFGNGDIFIPAVVFPPFAAPVLPPVAVPPPVLPPVAVPPPVLPPVAVPPPVAGGGGAGVAGGPIGGPPAFGPSPGGIPTTADGVLNLYAGDIPADLNNFAPRVGGLEQGLLKSNYALYADALEQSGSPPLSSSDLALVVHHPEFPSTSDTLVGGWSTGGLPRNRQLPRGVDSMGLPVNVFQVEISDPDLVRINWAPGDGPRGQRIEVVVPDKLVTGSQAVASDRPPNAETFQLDIGTELALELAGLASNPPPTAAAGPTLTEEAFDWEGAFKEALNVPGGTSGSAPPASTPPPAPPSDKKIVLLDWRGNPLDDGASARLQQEAAEHIHNLLNSADPAERERGKQRLDLASEEVKWMSRMVLLGFDARLPLTPEQIAGYIYRSVNARHPEERQLGGKWLDFATPEIKALVGRMFAQQSIAIAMGQADAANSRR